MIRHIVFFTARDRHDVPAIVEGLKLLGTIPHSSHFEVAENSRIDQIGNDVDVVVYAEFADEAALAAYKAHPTYAEATRRVRPLRELRLAADFAAADDAAPAAQAEAVCLMAMPLSASAVCSSPAWNIS